MNTNTISESKAKRFKLLIIIASIAIPLVVAILFGVKKIEGYNLSFLPPIYAGINALTAILLVVALIAIKAKNKNLHNFLINICIFLSLLF